MLIRLEFQLNRSPKTIQNYINRLLQFLPDDSECVEWLKNIQPLKAVNPPSSPPVPAKIYAKNTTPIQNAETANTEVKYKIEKSMATLTMAQVLKSQAHYSEALAVLDVLESNGCSSNLIAQKKEEILQLISASQK